MELLQEIAHRRLPMTVTDIENIDKLRVLRAAGHVAVFLTTVRERKQVARVLAITEKGREALRDFEPVSS
jgi:hypothetical protein